MLQDKKQIGASIGSHPSYTIRKRLERIGETKVNLSLLALLVVVELLLALALVLVGLQTWRHGTSSEISSNTHETIDNSFSDH